MARPLSDEKREALLRAATHAIAELGPAAPISRIASAAGVAEGTLYTYFATKQELFSQLFIMLETDFSAAILDDLPHAASPREQLRHVWWQLVNWGVRDPIRLKALLQLKASPDIDDASRRKAGELLAEVQSAIHSPLRAFVKDARLAFYAGPILIALVETTQKAVLADPGNSDALLEAGFDVYWNGIQQ